MGDQIDEQAEHKDGLIKDRPYSRQVIFALGARKMRADFEGLRSLPHSGVKGQQAERILRKFLDLHLPKRFGVGAGFIIDATDSISKQTDVIIYDAFNCPTYMVSEDASIFPSDNVAAVVEVKSVLTKAELSNAFENISTAKKLVKSKPRKGQLVTTQTLGCLFAFGSAITLDTIVKHYSQLLTERGLGHHIDIIAVLDKGIIVLFAKPRRRPWGMIINWEGRGEEGTHIGLGKLELGDNTLDTFFRSLLVHLSLFRNDIDRAVFRWKPQEVELSYLTSVSLLKSARARERKLEEYAKEAEEEFRSSVILDDGQTT